MKARAWRHCSFQVAFDSIPALVPIASIQASPGVEERQAGPSSYSVCPPLPLGLWEARLDLIARKCGACLLMNNDLRPHLRVPRNQKWVRVDEHCPLLTPPSPGLSHLQSRAFPLMCSWI